ncbi:MAG: hypothetical protein JKX85_13305 [Phycisphaeraceae bacterium]|nr:hypothetical protein [Phycisphaeraceae bacterium]
MRFQTLPTLCTCTGLFMLGALNGCNMMGNPHANGSETQAQTQTALASESNAKVGLDADDLNVQIQVRADALLAAIDRQQAQARLKKLASKKQPVLAESPRVNQPEMDRLASALEQHAKSAKSSLGALNVEPLPQVKWLDLQPVPTPVITTTPIAQAPKMQQTVSAVVTPEVPIVTVANMGLGADSDTASLGEQMAVSIRNSEQTALQKSLALSSLSLSSNHNLLQPQDLKDLDPNELQQVRKMHIMVLQTLSSQTQNKVQDTDEQAGISDQLSKLFGSASARISKVEFCRTVAGYGVYEPFESTTFMAGVEQPLILYVELENFNSIHDGSQYRVRLTQEVELYTDSDGVRVWSLPREQIVDMSRNKRRDFFTVQLLHLPARLGVGKYRMKIRIHDINGGSYDETTVPVILVASQSTTARGYEEKSELIKKILDN